MLEKLNKIMPRYEVILSDRPDCAGCCLLEDDKCLANRACKVIERMYGLSGPVIFKKKPVWVPATAETLTYGDTVRSSHLHGEFRVRGIYGEWANITNNKTGATVQYLIDGLEILEDA